MKLGDKVIIKTKEELKKEFSEDVRIFEDGKFEICFNPYFNKKMIEDFCGKEVTVKEVKSTTIKKSKTKGMFRAQNFTIAESNFWVFATWMIKSNIDDKGNYLLNLF